MDRFSPKTIHLWTTKNSALYAHLAPHARRAIIFFANYSRSYFRRLYKEFLLLSPLILLAALLLNLQIPKSNFERNKEDLLFRPSDPTPHITLSKQLSTYNQFLQAHQELILAINLVNTSKQRHPLLEDLSKIETIAAEPSRLQQEIHQWQNTLKEHPNYRDGYLKLAILTWKLYRPFESQKHLTKALSIDPNNKELLKFKNELQ